jgi:coproporphyrinogen III oxidase-like Fe-S oxidoreductase
MYCVCGVCVSVIQMYAPPGTYPHAHHHRVVLPHHVVSNFAVPGEECVHNLQYWCGGDFLGLGPSASGRVQLRARQRTGTDADPRTEVQRAATKNHVAMTQWYESVEGETGSGFEEVYSLDAVQQRQELLMMGLRRREGVCAHTFLRHTGLSLQRWARGHEGVRWCVDQRLLQYERRGGLRATASGLNLLNSVLDRIL